MALIGQRLPVRFIPEQLHIALVGNDVVDDGRSANALFTLLTLITLAKWVLFQEPFTRLAPFVAITTARSTSALVI